MNMDIFEKSTSALKNLCQIVLFIGVITVLLLLVFSEYERGQFRKLVDQLGLESVAAAGLEVKFKELQKEALKLVNAQVAPEQKPVPQDTVPTSGVSKVLSLVDETGSFWVYLGPFKSGAFTSRPNFEIKTRPQEGSIIVAATDTYKRAREPYEIKKGDWKLGEIKGVVKEGQSVKVLRVSEIEGDEQGVNLWAQAISAG
jgi:hypothetical protein